MSYVQHTAIIVTGYSTERLEAAREKALSLFQSAATDFSSDILHRAGIEGVNLTQRLLYLAPYGLATVSPLLMETCNSVYSFMIAPDGSKAGWGHAEAAEIARKVFISWLHDQRDRDELSSYLTWVEVSYDNPTGDALVQTNRTGVARYDLDRLLTGDDNAYFVRFVDSPGVLPAPDQDRHIRLVNLGLITVDYSAKPRTYTMTPEGRAYRTSLRVMG